MVAICAAPLDIAVARCNEPCGAISGNNAARVFALYAGTANLQDVTVTGGSSATNWNVTCGARTARKFAAIPTSAAIW